jgi:hypothetical protein
VLAFRLQGVEAGQEGPDAELELVVGGAAGQLGGQLDGVGELAGEQGGEEGPHAADVLVAGLGVGAAPGGPPGRRSPGCRSTGAGRCPSRSFVRLAMNRSAVMTGKKQQAAAFLS